MQDLIDQIAAAFADVAYPGDDNLTDSRYGEEPAALVADFKGKTDWRALTPAFLNQAPDGWGTATAFFSAAALQFYLPAYLIADIRDELECSDPSTRLCAFVTPPMENKKLAAMHGGGTLGAHARNEFARFSPAQVAAIVAYLWWKLDTGPYNPLVEQALENYWLERDAAGGQT